MLRRSHATTRKSHPATWPARQYRTPQVVWLCLLSCLLLIGCSNEDENRHHLSGQVTYKGQSVHSGTIYFEPDASKGNRGPQGYSSIVSGRYETTKFGKGAMTGPIRVMITGFPAPEREGDLVNEPLFPMYQTSTDVSPETTTLDFEVPAEHGSTR